MVWDLFARFLMAIGYLLQALVVGVVRFVIALLGPGLTAALVGVIAVLWWFKWI